MNTPYVKTFDEQGLVSNEITKNNPYVNNSSNRKKRRELLQKNRFNGNKKGISISVIGGFKYKRIVQLVNGKRILHQLPF